jgi:hypothetical protein
MTLIFIYGPAASGKLTIARELGALTGLAVFHNHLVVDAVAAVFPFGSDRFVELREQFWLTVTSGFPEAAKAAVESSGGDVAFVRLTVPAAEQERRLTAPSRAEFGKMRSVELLRELRDRCERCEERMPDPAMTIATEERSPAQSARSIAEAFHLLP